MRKVLFVFVVITTVLLYACGGNGSEGNTGASPADKLTGGGKTEAPAASGGIVISGGDDMKFDLKEIKVKAGETVKLTLKHSGQLPKEAMGHNWVLLQQGVDIATFATAAMNAKETDYIPEGDGDQVIVHTQLIGGGETTSIEFQAPPAGTYDFICSFPGHYVMMQGKFIVE